MSEGVHLAELVGGPCDGERLTVREAALVGGTLHVKHVAGSPPAQVTSVEAYRTMARSRRANGDGVLVCLFEHVRPS